MKATSEMPGRHLPDEPRSVEGNFVAEQRSQTVFAAVTVIMPIRNEKGHIAQSLGSVLAQDYPADRLEVLVVDGMSVDGTRDLVRQMIADRPNVRLLDNPGRAVPTALNGGIREATGEVIIRVDGHCQIAPDYVRRCVEVMRQVGADAVGGLQRATGADPVGRGVALATSSPFGVGNARFHYAARAGWTDTVYLGAYRREAFDRIGRFDEDLVRNQDDEFNFRLIQAGGRIWLDPTIRSVYHSRANLRGLWRQYYEYGLYKVRVIQKRGAVPSWRHLVPAAFVLVLLGSLLLALFTHQPFWLLSVAGPYALASALASLWTARHDWRTLPVLPLAFATIHIAYGIGFLSGLWHWRRLPWKSRAGLQQADSRLQSTSLDRTTHAR